MWFEVLTCECVEVWESLKLDSYSNESGYCIFRRWVLRLGKGVAHEVMLVEWGIFGP